MRLRGGVDPNINGCHGRKKQRIETCQRGGAKRVPSRSNYFPVTMLRKGRKPETPFIAYVLQESDEHPMYHPY